MDLELLEAPEVDQQSVGGVGGWRGEGWRDGGRRRVVMGCSARSKPNRLNFFQPLKLRGGKKVARHWTSSLSLFLCLSHLCASHREREREKEREMEGREKKK